MGECNRCGGCCTMERPEDALPGVPVHVEGMCPYFRWLEDGTGLCVGRDTERYRTVCAEWPRKPADIDRTKLPWCSVY